MEMDQTLEGKDRFLNNNKIFFLKIQIWKAIELIEFLGPFTGSIILLKKTLQ